MPLVPDTHIDKQIGCYTDHGDGSRGLLAGAQVIGLAGPNAASRAR